MEVTQMYKVVISFFVIVLLFFNACGNNSESQTQVDGVPVQFRSQLTTAVKVYFELKDALVNSDSKLAAEKAFSFKTALSNIQSDLLSGQLLTSWQERGGSLEKAVDEFTSKEDIAAQREAFLPMSKTVIACAKDYGPLNMTVYVQHCPMAFDNTGGDWLSNTEKVFNPYFGEGMMYNCGNVKETIAQN
jgi:Cu(I)/Ag(I) efflux system membrane fusion protein